MNYDGRFFGFKLFQKSTVMSTRLNVNPRKSITHKNKAPIVIKIPISLTPIGVLKGKELVYFICFVLILIILKCNIS